MGVAWKDFVVGIDGQNGKPVGTGFLVAPNYVVTCTHVVVTALAKESTDPVVGDEIIAKLYQQLKFPRNYINFPHATMRNSRATKEFCWGLG